jgi:hypothetical protein
MLDVPSLVVGFAAGAVALRLLQHSSARAITRGETGDEKLLHATPADPKAEPPAERRGAMDIDNPDPRL